ncbi:PIN domain-containing protein [Streptomyces gibsoniae]|uniref:PIN domain-containing protein n=1 Tax=Streptomyces gibsoniae TaxID=3075529 RepID=A0ABU2TWL5_9ACTN|nr:PIN domain-containing protein [Streptomyces sp. DSM 41699]MDT0465343.1 PIN domain-containing protein [Streptomyces sp. DSM 41699]
MRLKNGVSLGEAEAALREAELIFQAVTAFVGSRPPYGFDLYEEYMEAVDQAHGRLTWVFAEPDLAERLHSTAFWHLASMERSSLGAQKSLIYRETQRQLSSLEDAKCALECLKKLAQLPGMPVIYDTNMLNHWVQPSDVHWRQVFSAVGLKVPLVRLVVPMTVIDELDRQKYGQGDLARKAATAIRYLNRVFSNQNHNMPVEIRKGEATLEVWYEPGGRRREVDADMEILRCASDLSQLIPNERTHVLTDDTGMRLRAQQMGLSAVRLPEEYRKPGTAISSP